jgi:hypothetical protein
MFLFMIPVYIYIYMGTGHMDWPVPIGIFERLRGETNWHVSSSQGPAYLRPGGWE